ncbi:Duf1674 domain-containing protein [Colletotrichum higginsianum IMI 349063]|uniref:Succinate dehydrogenase assembly factor 4, mitochondrial n=2 Tax=Colletotrichum higginsianum TaxID=80884 RepID=A0A1B7XUK5_COLHI|nr:Duf1674 domain-containing protein [Colletotrichum higginsianum IMI 349063]OBR03436.1 Duf1674 domain-containing protein [Colletotrichum higginsianum IMI 349063]TIC89797.1 Succinate dehydrogenase assembly factor 4, mitochondrial [Colletotrichum higginsianum]GJD02218.1 DUF1674 domain-containing protein [Colletotrichum higginsianum]
MSRLLRLHRTLALTPPARRLNSSFTRGPAPPRLPPDQQAEFERLQRQASVSSAFQHLVEDAPDATPAAATTTSSSSSSPSDTVTAAATAAASDAPNTPTPTVAATDEDTMHPNYVRGAPPEFEGDVNPRTGEVGGPKREPLRWGAAGDWSYNGRVTDF